MSARRLDLLEKLCVLLEGLPPQRFDYGHWASDPNLHACGTTACALGWATTIPECGLRLVRDEDGIHVAGDTPTVNPLQTTLDAASIAFGLRCNDDESNDDAWSLFIPEAYSEVLEARAPKEGASAREVAAWIRRHIAVWAAEQGASS